MISSDLIEKFIKIKAGINVMSDDTLLKKKI